MIFHRINEFIFFAQSHVLIYSRIYLLQQIVLSHVQHRMLETVLLTLHKYAVHGCFSQQMMTPITKKLVKKTILKNLVRSCNSLIIRTLMTQMCLLPLENSRPTDIPSEDEERLSDSGNTLEHLTF